MNISTFASPTLSAPQVKTAIDARVKALNAAGGIKGQPVEVTYCNDKFDPNAAAACARQAVDSKAVAVVGSLSPEFTVMAPLLQQAGIPWVGGLGSDPAELTSPISYPFQGGAPAAVLGQGRILVDKGAKKVSILTGDNTGSLQAGDNIAKGVQAGGETVNKRVSGANGHADWSAEVAAALSGGTDGVAFGGTPIDGPKIVRALRQAGFKGSIAMSGSSLPPAAIKALGSDADGVYIPFRLGPPSDVTNTVIAQFQKEMMAQDPSASVDELALNAWTAMNLFSEIAKTVTTVSADTVRSAFDSMTSPIKLGTVPDYPPAPAAAPHAQFPRVRNFFVVVAQVQNGNYVSDGKFIDPLGK